MITFLLKGLIFGLSAGISPGPLTTLVVSETLMHKTWAGVKVAVAPLITDGPIIILCYFLLTRISNVPLLIGFISICGALYIFYLGVKSIRLKEFVVDVEGVRSQSLTKGILTNALSPHPYVFWISVGSTTMLKAMDVHVMALFLFLFGFYFCLLGTKIVLAIGVGMSRHLLSHKVFIIINNILGLVLIVFAGLLFYEGIQYLYEG